tara:strand:- start:2059 stop:2835 length:777 start_codon:yes stop_codon:yes gene_type:complete
MLKKKKNFNSKFLKLFKSLKIKKNSKVMLHSNVAGIYQFQTVQNKNFAKKKFLNLLIKLIGNNGELIIPAYNYDFTKNKVFYLDRINSQVGELSNFFLKNFKNTRTLNPVFSHAILKNNVSKKFFYDPADCLGKNSFFNYIHRENFKIVGFCTPLSAMTFVLYVECLNKVRHRFYKKFTSKIIKNKKKIILTINYFVAKKNIDCSPRSNKIEMALRNFKSFRKKNFGKFNCWSVDSKDVFSALTGRIKIKNDFLITGN